MTKRMENCRYCQDLTGGDCGRHGGRVEPVGPIAYVPIPTWEEVADQQVRSAVRLGRELGLPWVEVNGVRYGLVEGRADD